MLLIKQCPHLRVMVIVVLRGRRGGALWFGLGALALRSRLLQVARRLDRFAVHACVMKNKFEDKVEMCLKVAISACV